MHPNNIILHPPQRPAKYKSDIRNTWKTINNFFSRKNKTNLVNNITYLGDKDFKHYLEENLNCKFALNNVDGLIEQKTIDNLPSKNSTGIDGISTNLANGTKNNKIFF